MDLAAAMVASRAKAAMATAAKKEGTVETEAMAFEIRDKFS